MSFSIVSRHNGRESSEQQQLMLGEDNVFESAAAAKTLKLELELEIKSDSRERNRA